MKSHRDKCSRRLLHGFELLEPRALLAAQPIINEIMASNESSLEDGFGQDSDWIELYNAGDAAVDLQGYHLTDSHNNLTKWTFPISTILNPGEYLIVFASDQNTIDPLGYHHTNYKLSAEGEDIVLVSPDLTILSQIGPNGEDFPPQLTDISYGLSGPLLVDGLSPASYLIPTNGNLGLAWTQANFNAASNGFTSGKASLGYDSTTNPINFANHFRTQVPSGTTSVYLRSEFNLQSVEEITSLNLNLKYDDGIAVYLNGSFLFGQQAPASPQWNSLATGIRDDQLVVAGNDFSLTPHIELLQAGKNVLAIHVMNASSGSSDLLIDPQLTANISSNNFGYLSVPTPGGPNSALIEIGPIIDAVEFVPSAPIQDQAITVTAQVTAFASPVDTSSVQLTYRVMYGSEVQVVMVDDGTAGDALAGDGVYTAQISASAFSADQMVRWYVTAADTNGTTTRAPRFLDPLDSPEYYGTVIVDPSLATNLPVIYWFVQDPGAAATEAGTRASLYMLGQFYDNIRVDLHGQSTSGPDFPKKSFNFDANNGLKFEVDTSFGRVSDFNLLTNYADKTYLRNTMAYELYAEAGGPGHYAFSAVVYRNGSYYGLYDVVEDGDEEFLERVGLDPNGALYKLNNAFNSTTNEVEKKSREWEDRSDLQQLVSSASLNALAGQTWVYDNLDISSWVNYFAVQSLIANRDYGQKNYYLYNDSDGTELWSLLPWDVDLSFGHQWNFEDTYFDDDLIYNDGYYVYMGGNHLIERLKSYSQFSEMYRRRLRTLVDEFYGLTGSDIEDSFAARRFDELLSEIGAEAIVDRDTWGVHGGMAMETPAQAIARVKEDFLALRRQHLVNLANFPASQVAQPNVAFGTIDFNPTSGNQAQEVIALVNSGSTAVDVSGWTVSGDVQHTFVGGTVIPAMSTYYLVADVAEFKLRTEGPRGGQRLFIQGNYAGELNNQYGELQLHDNTGGAIATTSFGVPVVAGDYDSSGTVDHLDYIVWKSTFGSMEDLRADGNGNNVVDTGDYTIWRDNLPQVGKGAAALAAVSVAADTQISDAQLVQDAQLVHLDERGVSETSGQAQFSFGFVSFDAAATTLASQFNGDFDNLAELQSLNVQELALLTALADLHVEEQGSEAALSANSADRFEFPHSASIDLALADVSLGSWLRLLPSLH